MSLWSWLGLDELGSVRREQRRIDLAIQKKKVELGKRIMENLDYLDRLVDPMDRFRDGERLLMPLGTINDRRFGQNAPTIRSEVELQQYRGVGRLLCEGNAYAIGMMRNLRNFTIGRNGFTYRAVAKPAAKDVDGVARLAAQTQAVIDEFIQRECWYEREQEAFWRSRRDGEAFFRAFHLADSGRTTIRMVEPEQVGAPPNITQAGPWSFGILNRPHDVETPEAYWVKYLDNDGVAGEEVPACDMVHIKLNVDRSVKRGMTDFFAVDDIFEGCRKLTRNMREGAAVQAAIAIICQHEQASEASVVAYRGSQVDYSRTNPVTGRQVNYSKLEPGTRLDIPKGMSFAGTPAGEGAPIFIQVLQACLRSICARWNAPEYFTGDASNANYASTLVAGSPFVTAIQVEQTFYKSRFLQVMWIVLNNAVSAGLLPAAVLDLIDIQVEPPEVAIRSRLEDAQVKQIERQNGVVSVQTWAASSGYDPEREQQNIDIWNDKNGPPPGPLPGFAA